MEGRTRALEEELARTKLALDEARLELEKFRKGPAEEEQQHKLFRVILETVPVPLFIKDEKGIYLACNTAFGELFGVHPSELPGKTVYDVAPKELADIYYNADNALFKDGGDQIYETAVRRPDGVLRKVVFRKAAFYNEDGSLGGLVGSIFDITERKHIEEALRASEEKFSKAFRFSPDWIFLSAEDGTLLDVNDTFVKDTGYSRQEALGRTCVDLGIWNNPADRTSLAQILLTEGRVLSKEVRFRSKKGDLIITLCSAEFIDLAGVRCVLTVVRDITKRKRAEEEREELIIGLQEALAKVKALSGLLPICAWCKKIRDDQGYWKQVDHYIQEHSNAMFTHGICPECSEKLKAK